jgi:hypothetical protein
MMRDPSTEAPARGAGRVARLVVGWTLLVSGAVLLVLPGPGVPLVLGGLALLAREQAWAGRLHRKVHECWIRARERLQARRGPESAPPRGDGG